MKIQEHIDKITWSLADKFLYIVYGIVTLFQMKALDPKELALFGLLISLHTWIFIVSDSFLNNLIQFGMNLSNRKWVNFVTFSLHVILSFGMALIIFAVQKPIASLFNEPRLIEVATILPFLCLLFIPRTFCIKLILRDNDMKRLFITNLAFFAPMTILTIYYIFSLHTLNYSIMIFIYIIGSAFSSLASILVSWKKLEFSFKKQVPVKKLLSFGFPLMLNGAMNSLIKQLDVYIVQFFFSTAVSGVYYSAKNLFRVFDETTNAALSLVYPAAVRQTEKKNDKELNDLVTKSVSFLFVSYSIIVLILELGLSKLFITWLLPVKYIQSVGFLNIMLISALFLPFIIFGTIINAMGRPYISLRNVIIAIIFSLATFLTVGWLQIQSLIPLGMVVYIFIYGMLSLSYNKQFVRFRFKDLFRIFADSKHYFAQKMRKK